MRAHLLLALLALAACKSEPIGTQRVVIGVETIDQIEPGLSRPHVTALLGEPLEKIQLVDDQIELWKWSYTEKRSPSGSIVLRIDNEPRTEDSHMCYVEFKNGRVTRAWRD